MKKCIYVSILIIFSLCFLIGCTDSQDTDYINKIIGTWWFEQSDFAEGFIIYYNFYDNGSMEIDANFTSMNLTDVFGNYSEIITNLWPMKGEYIITKDNISMRYPINIADDTPDVFLPYNYSFYDDYNKLELIDMYNEITILNRLK